MKDFIMAALPYVAIGITLAVLAANFAGRKKKQGKDITLENDKANQSCEQEEESENYMTIGMCIGMCIGTSLGSSGVVDLSIGISFGMLFIINESH